MYAILHENLYQQFIEEEGRELIQRCTTGMMSRVLIALAPILIFIFIFHDRPAYSEENAIPTVTVEEAVMATGVENLVPVAPAASFDANIGKLYCFTRIKSNTQPTSIKHLWFHGDKIVMEITLPIKATNWRTYSTKTILPSASGTWRVDITTEDGKVLRTLNFTIR